MTALTVSVEDGATAAEEDAVTLRLRAYNARHAGDPGFAPLNLFLRDGAGGIVGGLLGSVYYGWLFVNILWVADEHRGGGHGAALVRRAEAEARARGCRAVWLDTFSFQAPGFYRKMGFTEFGRLDDYPAGHTRHFLWKPLD
jgi:GNAT superfamily N-acetyltransferase